MKVCIHIWGLAAFLTLANLTCDAATPVIIEVAKEQQNERVRFTATCTFSISESVNEATFEINMSTPIYGFKSREVRVIAKDGNVRRVEVKRRRLRPPSYVVTFTGNYVGNVQMLPNGTCSAFEVPDTYAGLCDPGWKQFGYSCLLILHSKNSWPGSQGDCGRANVHSHLVLITTKTKNDFVLKMIQDSSVLDDFWIGGWNIDGYFAWTDGIPFSDTFTNWLPGSPQSLSPGTSVAMKYPERQWLDSYDGFQLRAVCEYCWS